MKDKTNYIRDWREYRGITTQLELSRLSGIDQTQISRLESGDRPYNRRHLEKLAKVLVCKVGDLLSTDPFAQSRLQKLLDQLDDDARDELVVIAQAILDHRKKGT